MKKIFKLFALLAMLTACAACEGEPSNGDENDEFLSGSISLLSNHDIIRSNGTDEATLTVLLTDDGGIIHDVTAQAEIYLSTSEEPMAGNKFATSQEGRHTLYALYGLAVSNNLEIKAVGGISDTPTDSNASSTDFSHRLLAIQHTGTGCPNCPALMNNLKRVSEDANYASKYYHIASHSYNADDKAYSSSAAMLSGELNVHSYPWISFNFVAAKSYLGDIENIKSCIDLFHEESARVGISAASNVIDGTIYANINIKAAEAGNYRVGMWVLEDNIYSTQASATASWQNNHNNCLREMAGKNKNERLYGKSVGMVAAGAQMGTIISAEVNSEWYLGNCKLLFFVATDDGNGGLELVNSILCPVGESVGYAYN